MNKLRRLLAVAVLGLAAGWSGAAPDPEESPVKTEAMQDFWWGDFTALEQLNDRLRHGMHADADGVSELEMVRQGISRVVYTSVEHHEAYLRELEAFTEQWAIAHPASGLAHVLHADVLLAHAWSYRGTGYVKDVPPEAWKDFQTYLRRAVDYLNAHASVALTDTYAHYVLLQVGRGMGWSQKQMMAVLDDGIQRNPQDISLYVQMLTSLLPKWGGDARTLDNYIRDVASRTKADQGMAMYARLYSAASQEEFGHKLFEDSYADWDLMKQGYDDMLARYPDSVMRLNRYAYMACLAKDRPTLLALFARIGKRFEAMHWGPNPERSLEGCQRWGRGT